MNSFCGGRFCEVLLMGLGVNIRTPPILEVLQEALEEQPTTAKEFLVSVRNIAESKGMKLATLGINPGSDFSGFDWKKELEFVQGLDI